jgi:predicted permease
VLPRWLYGLEAHLRAIVRRPRADGDLDDELAFHLAQQTQENIRRGMSPADAARHARIALGGLEQTKETVRDGRPLYSLEIFMQDVRYALRLIARAPGFAAVAILTVALGIGANTAIFSIVNGVLLRPLPYKDPDRLVRVYLANPTQKVLDGTLSVPEVDDWRSRAQSLSSITGYQVLPSILMGRGEPTEIRGAYFVGDFFGTLGGTPILGRLLTEDDVRQAVMNAVISERLWRTRFDADPAIVGKSISLSARTFTIVGVISEEFRYPEADTVVWGPHSIYKDEDVGPRVRNQRIMEVVARLAPGVTADRAQAELSGIAARLEAEFPQTNKEWTASRVTSLRTSIVGSVDTALVVVLAVVGFVLLIACANLANLLLARGTARGHELATRAALGAGRGRIVRQLLTESLVLGVLGGVLGIALSVWGVDTIVALSADTLPRVDDIRVDTRVIGFGLALTALTAVLFGIIPALRAANASPAQRLGGTRGSVGAGRRSRNVLVVAEVAIAVVLVIGATLMARSFLTLRGVNPGFDRDGVLAVTLMHNLASGSGNLGDYLRNRREQVLERLRALPGVVDAGTIVTLPLEGRCRDSMRFIKPNVPQTAASVMNADNCIVSPGYLRTMRIPLLRGEMLPDAPPPAGAPYPFLISESAAKKYWPNEDPIGQVVRANYGGRAMVVGIVGDVRQNGLGEAPPPVVYFHQRTAPRVMTTIVVRTNGDPMALAAPIRAAIREIDPDQPIRSLSTLNEVMSESIARDRFFTLLFGLFGVLALTLAAIGVYGVLAYSVGQRTKEIGVRMALGAQASQVLKMVLGEGMRLVVTGVVLGAGASLLLTRVLASQLHGISAKDPMTFVLAPAILIAVALLACYLPARRATRVHAVAALRAE